MSRTCNRDQPPSLTTQASQRPSCERATAWTSHSGVSTQLISTYAYNTAFLFSQYGQAAAMTIALLLLILLLGVIGVRFLRRSAEATT